VLAAGSETGLPLLNLFWTILLFFVLAFGVWLLIVVFRDVFTSRDMSTGAKVGWTVLVFVVPWLGSLIYLATHERGDGPGDQHAPERDLWRVESAQQRTYVPNFH